MAGEAEQMEKTHSCLFEWETESRWRLLPRMHGRERGGSWELGS
jgi:hypothetical protein